MGILKILINFLIFSLPLGAITRFTLLPNFSVSFPDFISVLIFTIVSYRFFITRKILNKKLFVLILGFIIVGFASLLLNLYWLTPSQFLISVSYLVRFIFYASIIFAFGFLGSSFNKTIPAKLIIAGLLFILFGLLQYFLYPNLRNLFYAGWDEHLYRLFSTFLDPNFAGAFLVLIFILVLENLIFTFNEKGRIRVWFSLFLVVTSIAIFLTYSRSAFIMLLVGVALLFFLHRLYRILVVATFGLLVAFVLFSNTNIEGLNPLRLVSFEARINSADEAFSIFLKNPFLGVGFNSYRYALKMFGFRVEQSSLLSNADAGTDNSYLFVLATTGILGLLFYIVFWLNVLRIVYKKISSNYSLARVAFVSVVAVMVDTLFINSIFYTSIMAWLFILIGVTVSKKE